MAKLKMTKTANRERAKAVSDRLRQAYPDARCTLDYTTPLELLVGTILAAQCTDERVNMVTKALFKKYPTAQHYLAVPVDELESDIRSCGFYRNKAKSIRRACEALLERFDGEVPGTMEDLLSLDGVGRKTANVILGECFGTPGIVVDTHCTRLAKRLGFTKNSDAVKIERDLMELVDQSEWTMFSHRFVFHGRAICQARAPKCHECVLRDLCPFPDSAEGKRLVKKT